MPSIAIDDRLLLLLFFWFFSSHHGVFLFGKQSQRLECFSNDTIGSKSDGKRMEDREHQGGEKKSEKKGNRMLGSKTKKKKPSFYLLDLTLDRRRQRGVIEWVRGCCWRWCGSGSSHGRSSVGRHLDGGAERAIERRRKRKRWATRVKEFFFPYTFFSKRRLIDSIIFRERPRALAPSERRKALRATSAPSRPLWSRRRLRAKSSRRSPRRP